MPRFSTDADLLDLEPNVFVDLPFASQRTLEIDDAAISGATVASASGGFSSLDEDAVVVIGPASDRVTAAVSSVIDNHALVLSAAPMGLPDELLPLSVRTFAPQAEAVAGHLLAAVGLAPDESSQVVSTDLMRRLSQLGVLAQVFEAARGIADDHDAAAGKADRYRRRFVRALASSRVLLDVDGDGVGDVWRSPGVGRLTRL